MPRAPFVFLSALALLTGLVFLSRAEDPPTDSRLQEIDALFAEAYPPDEPGAVVILVEGGETVFRQAYGLADVELSVPMTPDNVLRLGSVTKQFTAVAVMLLVEDGRLDLDAPVTRYLPDYPARPEGAEPITLRHLLTHTSGVPSYTSFQDFEARMRENASVAEMLDRFDEKPLDFEPGTRFRYSNSGYSLLGAVLEAVSGQSYGELVEERIFDPLGMEHTSYGDPERIVPRRAEGYQGTSGNYENAPYISMTQPHAAGALVSTVDDLAHWNAALQGDELLGEASKRELWTPQRLDNGLPTGYGFGWVVSEHRGRPVIQHGGGIPGFASFTAYWPEDELYVAVLSNNPQDQPGPMLLGLQASQIWLGLERPEVEPVDVHAAVLDEYVGTYELGPGAMLSVAREGDGLSVQLTGQDAMAVEPVSETRFAAQEVEAEIEFVRNGAGEVVGLQLHQTGASRPAVRVSSTPGEIPGVTDQETVEVPAEILEGYVGIFQLAPGFRIEITREGDRLFAQATGQARYEIFPKSRTRFFYKVVPAEIELETRLDGHATGLVLFQGGREMRAARVEGE